MCLGAPEGLNLGPVLGPSSTSDSSSPAGDSENGKRASLKVTAAFRFDMLFKGRSKMNIKV